MKASNLLISNDGSLKIADFGLSRTYDSNISNSREGGHRGKERKYTNCVVTRWYRPPELLMGARQYGGEVDIWGIGCVISLSLFETNSYPCFQLCARRNVYSETNPTWYF